MRSVAQTPWFAGYYRSSAVEQGLETEKLEVQLNKKSFANERIFLS